MGLEPKIRGVLCLLVSRFTNSPNADSTMLLFSELYISRVDVQVNETRASEWPFFIKMSKINY